MAIIEGLVDELQAQNPEVVSSKMFGMPTLKVGGKAFAGEFEGDMVFKLAGDAHQQALELSGAHLFDPMGGRPMKEWVMIPVAHQATWPDFAKAALSYMEGLTK
jgi:hypothetical protein